MLEEGVRKAGGERGCDLWGQKADFTFCVTDVVERLESFFATTTTAAADSYNSKYTWKTVRRGWKCVETFPWEEVKCSRLSLERRPIMVLNTRAPGFFFSHIGFFFLLKSTSSRPLFLKKILRHCIFFCRITTSEFMPSMSVVMMIPSYSPGTIYRFLFEGFLKALHHYFSTHKKNVFSEETISAFFYSLHLAVVAINKLMTTIIDFSCNSSWSSTKLRVVAVMMMAICKKLCFWFSSLRLAEAESDRWHCATQLWIR